MVYPGQCTRATAYDQYVLITHSRNIQAACATSGDGLYEGLEWLSANIKRRV